jgi:lysozyme family protein
MTVFGISRFFNPKWEGWKIVDAVLATTRDVAKINQKMRADNTLMSLVKIFYRVNYWNSLKLDQFKDQNLANELYDTCVNCGKTKAATIIQRALNILNNQGKDYPDAAKDGIVGPITLKLINTHPRPKELFKVANLMQGQHYIELAEKNHVYEKFFRSWLSRVTTVYE